MKFLTSLVTLLIASAVSAADISINLTYPAELLPPEGPVAIRVYGGLEPGNYTFAQELSLSPLGKTAHINGRAQETYSSVITTPTEDDYYFVLEAWHVIEGVEYTSPLSNAVCKTSTGERCGGVEVPFLKFMVSTTCTLGESEGPLQSAWTGITNKLASNDLCGYVEPEAEIIATTFYLDGEHLPVCNEGRPPFAFCTHGSSAIAAYRLPYGAHVFTVEAILPSGETKFVDYVISIGIGTPQLK